MAKKPVKKIAAKKSVAKPAKKVAKKSAEAKRPRGLPEQLRDAALKVLDERQAEEIFKVDLAGKSSMADYLIIASGRNSRQLSAIAHYLREEFAKLGVHPVRVEGASEGNWVLIDAGDVVVHLFRPEVRSYYNLENIWSK
ncbi:MAG TPA: ribosome silencing factor [Alphaproteobacteria bacterium]|nr:ribosome silencing factor [Alphaproteobacteria bacterium]